jgi:hypothetical protein
VRARARARRVRIGVAEQVGKFSAPERASSVDRWRTDLHKRKVYYLNNTFLIDNDNPA